MIKNFQKLAALGLAGLLTASMTGPALAANTEAADITVNGTGAGYASYQLLDLTTSLKSDTQGHEAHEGDHNPDCYNYSYSVKDKYAAILKQVLTLGDDADDAAIIEAIGAMTDRGDEIQVFANSVYELVKDLDPDKIDENKVFADVPQGYYLIVETATDGDNDSRSLVMLDTAGQNDIQVNSKESVPELDKEILETDDTKGTQNWQDAGDFDIGDDVKFRLTGTLPANIDAYTTYKYIFHDNLDAGLTLKADTIKVYIGEAELPENEYAVRTGEEATDCSFEVEIKNVKGLIEEGLLEKTGTIVVEYDATLNENAQTGEPGNINGAYLEFSNDVYGDGTGKTPENKVIGFTFKLNVNKVDSSNNPLAGAEFKLQKEINGVYEDYMTLEISEGQTEFDFVGLDSGKYKLVETKVPAGYNKADDIDFEVVATYETESEDINELVLTGLEIRNAEGEVISGTAESGAAFEIAISDGSMVTTVVNSSGVHLPTTGGAGAYLVYGLGALAVIGGGGLYISRKKKSKAE